MGLPRLFSFSNCQRFVGELVGLEGNDEKIRCGEIGIGSNSHEAGWLVWLARRGGRYDDDDDALSYEVLPAVIYG